MLSEEGNATLLNEVSIMILMSTAKKLILTASVWAMPFAALAAPRDDITGVASNLLATGRIVVTLMFVLALVVFGWGVVKLIVAAGDPEKIKEAKQFIWWGVIGIAILASIFGLISFLQGYFGVTGGGGTIPIPVIPPSAP